MSSRNGLERKSFSAAVSSTRTTSPSGSSRAEKDDMCRFAPRASIVRPDGANHDGSVASINYRRCRGAVDSLLDEKAAPPAPAGARDGPGRSPNARRAAARFQDGGDSVN